MRRNLYQGQYTPGAIEYNPETGPKRNPKMKNDVEMLIGFHKHIWDARDKAALFAAILKQLSLRSLSRLLQLIPPITSTLEVFSRLRWPGMHRCPKFGSSSISSVVTTVGRWLFVPLNNGTQSTSLLANELGGCDCNTNQIC